MKLIFTSYINTPEYDQPEAWLKRIEAYTGILERLSDGHTVIGIERINYEGEFEQQGVHYSFINLRKKTVYFPFRMHRLITRLKPDVVFINGLIFPLQIIQLRLKLGRAVKIIVLHRAEKPFKGIKKYLQRSADKCIDAYLFASSEFGNEWKRNISIRKIHEVIQASSVFRVTDKEKAKSITNADGYPVFLWVGRLDANKDPITVITAFLKFLKDQPTARLYMIYHVDDLLPKIKDMISSNKKATDSIKLVGNTPHQQMEGWYNSSHFIISGSHYEGGGTSVSEAMSCGCIPVITNIPSFRKITGPGKCGMLYDPGNEKELLATLLKTKELDLETERKKVLQQFNNELSFEAIARKINKVISSL